MAEMAYASFFRVVLFCRGDHFIPRTHTFCTSYCMIQVSLPPPQPAAAASSEASSEASCHAWTRVICCAPSFPFGLNVQMHLILFPVLALLNLSKLLLAPIWRRRVLFNVHRIFLRLALPSNLSSSLEDRFRNLFFSHCFSRCAIVSFPSQAIHALLDCVVWHEKNIAKHRSLLRKNRAWVRLPWDGRCGAMAMRKLKRKRFLVLRLFFESGPYLEIRGISIEPETYSTHSRQSIPMRELRMGMRECLETEHGGRVSPY